MSFGQRGWERGERGRERRWDRVEDVAEYLQERWCHSTNRVAEHKELNKMLSQVLANLQEDVCTEEVANFSVTRMLFRAGQKLTLFKFAKTRVGPDSYSDKIKRMRKKLEPVNFILQCVRS